MYTGLVTGIGEVISLTEKPDGRLMTIQTPWVDTSIDIGASIACDGICLTATTFGQNAKGCLWFCAEAGSETLQLTTLSSWRKGEVINLERSLKIGDELGGHMVLGHVDGCAEVIAKEPAGDNVKFTIKVPQLLKRFIAFKGSVTLNGTSLTVNRVSDNHFDVCLIPHTLEVTTWHTIDIGDRLNIEVDPLARYADRLMQFRN